MDEANRQGLDELAGTRPAWGEWNDAVLYPLLIREAGELLNGQKNH
jgi:hypothetical protein